MSKIVVSGLGGIAQTIGQVTVNSGHTLQVNGNVYHDGYGAVRLPSGTTGQRPGSPQAGYMRWNTSTLSVEVYTGSTWKEFGSD
mgnify:FL=1